MSDAESPDPSVGALHVTCMFRSAADAKGAWEQIDRRCRGISANRWAPEGTVHGIQAVTVLADDTDAGRRTLARARALALAAGGEQVDTPAWALGPMQAKRAALLRAGASRRATRTPHGAHVGPDGTVRPLRRGPDMPIP